MAKRQVTLIATVGNSDVTTGNLDNSREAVQNAQDWLNNLNDKKMKVVAVTSSTDQIGLRFPLIEPACRLVLEREKRTSINRVILWNTKRQLSNENEPTLFSEIIRLGLPSLIEVENIELCYVEGERNLEETDFFLKMDEWFQTQDFSNEQTYVFPVGGMPHMQRAVSQLASLYCPRVVFLEKRRGSTNAEVNLVPKLLTMIRDRYHFRKLLRAHDFTRASQLFKQSGLYNSNEGEKFAQELNKLESIFEHGKLDKDTLFDEKFNFSDDNRLRFELLILRFYNAYHLGRNHEAILLCTAILDELEFHHLQVTFKISRSEIKETDRQRLRYTIERRDLTMEVIDYWINILSADGRNADFIETLRRQRSARDKWSFLQDIRIFEILLRTLVPKSLEIRDYYDVLRFERNTAAHQGNADVRAALDRFLVSFKAEQQMVSTEHFQALLDWVESHLSLKGPSVLTYPKRFAELAERALMRLPMTQLEASK